MKPLKHFRDQKLKDTHPYHLKSLGYLPFSLYQISSNSKAVICFTITALLYVIIILLLQVRIELFYYEILSNFNIMYESIS